MGAWEHEQNFQGNLGTKWILRNNLEFPLGEQSKKTFLGIREIFRNFYREHGNTDPLGGLMYKESYAKIRPG